jgi:hypothetical protein
MNRPGVTWDAPGQNIAAYPGATLALNREAWESLGAQFRAADDGQGETPNLATGSVQISDGPVAIGILDYGDETTYLLVPGDGDGRTLTTAEAHRTISRRRDSS